MKNTYPITPEQRAILESFTCERLKASRDNLIKIQNFISYRGHGLVNSLLTQGWAADNSGTTAYYVIKNAQGRIMMFFSLKCGVLFDPGYVKQFLDDFSETEQFLKNWRLAQMGDESAIQYLAEMEKLLGRGEFQLRLQTLKLDYKDQHYQLCRINADKRDEPNKKIIRVDKGHPAIELVEFCANDRTKGCWRDLFQRSMETRRHTMGKVFFWWFIVPKMIEVSQIAGCEYAYLFAADDNPDGDLVRYYEDSLHFRKLTHLGTIKPDYDLNCYFMGRRLFSVDMEHVDPNEPIRDEDDLRGLDYYRDQFFANFNLRPDVHDMI